MEKMFSALASTHSIFGRRSLFFPGLIANINLEMKVQRGADSDNVIKMWFRDNPALEFINVADAEAEVKKRPLLCPCNASLEFSKIVPK